MIKIKVRDLRVGDRVDLEKDPFADPRSDNPSFSFEYALVMDVEAETSTCVCVYIDGVDAFGFPPDHEIILAHRE
jgi:hypothetical protein